MQYAFVVLGGVLMVLAVAVGINVTEKRKRFLWAAFLLVVVLYIGIGSRVLYEADEKNKTLASELKKEKSDRKRLLDVTSSVGLNVEDLKKDISALTRGIGELRQSPSPEKINELQARAKKAELDVELLAQLYGQGVVADEWPMFYEAQYPGVLNWFWQNFPEAVPLHGQYRLFLYILLKQEGEVPIEFLRNIQQRFRQEFPTPNSRNVVFALMHQLQKAGFLEKQVEKIYPDRTIKLAEPYYSRFSNMEIP